MLQHLSNTGAITQESEDFDPNTLPLSNKRDPLN